MVAASIANSLQERLVAGGGFGIHKFHRCRSHSGVWWVDLVRL
jgi:hypothetical protein